MKKLLSGLMLLAFAGAYAQTAAPADMSVSRSAVCTAIQDREPTGTQESGEYTAATGVIYFWTEVQARTVPAALKHVWSHEGKVAAEIELQVRHARTRTWSTKKIFPGAWKVEAVDASGQVLQTAEFKIVP